METSWVHLANHNTSGLHQYHRARQGDQTGRHHPRQERRYLKRVGVRQVSLPCSSQQGSDRPLHNQLQWDSLSCLANKECSPNRLLHFLLSHFNHRDLHTHQTHLDPFLAVRLNSKPKALHDGESVGWSVTNLVSKSVRFSVAELFSKKKKVL